MLIYILQGLGYGFAAAAQPGPFQTYLISHTLNHGWRRTLPAALAPLVSDGPIIALALLVLSQVPAWFQRFLYLAGGLFILVLALSAYRGWRDFNMGGAPAGGGGLLRAALMNALSPAPYLYWSLVTGPILLAGWREAAAYAAAILAGFYLAMIGSLAGIITLFATARGLGPRVNRAMLGLSALALLGFGLIQVWRGLSGA
jgi:threonine/homoserine/homoserine lactone efflux protein